MHLGTQVSLTWRSLALATLWMARMAEAVYRSGLESFAKARTADWLSTMISTAWPAILSRMETRPPRAVRLSGQVIFLSSGREPAGHLLKAKKACPPIRAMEL